MGQDPYRSEQENPEHFQRLVAAAGHYAIFSIDLEGRVTTWNPGAQRMKGWAAEEILGQPFAILFPGELRDRDRPAFEMRYALETGPYVAEEPRIRKDGSRFDAEVMLQAVRDASGNPICFLKITEDITDRKRAERDAEATRRFLQELVAIIGHDLRNPLNAIKLSASLLRVRLGEPPLLGNVDRITEAANRAAEIVNGLLDLSQAQLLEMLPITRARVDLTLLAHQVTDEHRAATPGRELVVQPRGSTIGYWDSGRLMQVLSNLVTNALRHGAPNRPITMDIDGETEADTVRLSVLNFGDVIPPEAMADLFKPFRRGERASTTEKSLGLGLHIAKKIVEAHGGSIRVSSSGEGGTRFEFVLPRGSPGDDEVNP